MFLHRSLVPGLAICSYMIGDEASGRCAVIDPTRDVELAGLEAVSVHELARQRPAAEGESIAMPLWLVTAGWNDDEAELTQQWEVNAPTEGEAVREVVALLPSKPQHVEAKRLSDDFAPDLAPGAARKLA